MSTTDFHQSSPTISPAESLHMPTVAPLALLYPRFEGALPINTFSINAGVPIARSTRGGRAQTMLGTQSSPTTFLYPRVQAPYPTSRNRPHQHAAGYSSQPMSRDSSAQSKTSSSGRSGNGQRSEAAKRAAPYPLTVTRSAEESTTGAVGMSPPYGAVGLGIGASSRRRADLGTMSRASSLAESDPAMSTSLSGPRTSSMGVGKTSYRVFQEEAAYHSRENMMAYGENQSIDRKSVV